MGGFHLRQPFPLFRTQAATAVGALLLLVPAIVNGYPLVYSDTGTYLASAFEGYVPYDRPFWYGPFVQATSLGGATLWGVAVAQALLCAWLVRRLCKHLLVRSSQGVFLLICALLSAGTGLGWYAGRLLPDVFTGMGLAALWLLLRGGGTRGYRISDGAIIIAACWFHSSNLLIMPIAGAALLWMGRTDARTDARRRMITLASVSALAWGGLALANRVLTGEMFVSRNSHVFFIGRMIDIGMLKPYLDEHCDAERFGLCAYRDSLPANSQSFLWSDASPLARQGGWDATKEEYGRIVRGSFSQLRYLWQHARGSIASTAEQLCAWEICHAMESQWYRTETSPPYMVISRRLPYEFPRYMASLQNGGRGELSMLVPDLLYRLTLALSLLCIAVVWWRNRKSRPSEAMLFARFALAGVLVGAWVCASLSVVDTRYLSRDSWLLPLAAMIIVAELILARRTETAAP